MRAFAILQNTLRRSQRGKRRAAPVVLAAAFTSATAVAAVNAVRASRAQPGEQQPRTAGAAVPAFARATPGYSYSFPRDHASHPRFATEWWYFTGHLQAEDGQRFGYQVTFFRVALKPVVKRASRWATRDVIVGHFAITDITGDQFYFAEAASRAAAGLAGAGGPPANVWLHDWDMRFIGDGMSQQFRASGRSESTQTRDRVFALDLRTRALKKPVQHGLRGVSQKSQGAGQASHYYSFTRLQTTGSIRLGAKTFTVGGESWFDHEFGSSQLAGNQVGWDWFSLQLEDGRELMLYQLRTTDGGIDPYSSGTIVEKDGRSRHLARADFSISASASWTSTTGARYPATWTLTVPRERLVLTVTPELAAQELRTRITGVNYWEGAVAVSGTTPGRGYVELTGYDGTLGGKF